MVERTLYKLLLIKDVSLWDKYMNGMLTMLTKMYGPRLNSLYDILKKKDLPIHKKQLSFLMTLNHEQALKDHFLQMESIKTKRFFVSLHRQTEDFLDFKLNEQEYVDKCIEAWILA